MSWLSLRLQGIIKGIIRIIRIILPKMIAIRRLIVISFCITLLHLRSLISKKWVYSWRPIFIKSKITGSLILDGRRMIKASRCWLTTQILALTMIKNIVMAGPKQQIIDNGWLLIVTIRFDGFVSNRLNQNLNIEGTCHSFVTDALRILTEY